MSTVRKKILYIGNFDFPKNNAAGLRVLANGYLFNQLGFDVSFFGLSKKSTLVNQESDSIGFRQYDSFKYMNYPYPGGIKDWVFFGALRKKIITTIQSLKPEAVVLYGSPSNFLLGLLITSYCKQRKIIVISDCVDWLSGGSGSIAFRLGKWIDTEIQKRFVNTRANGLIVVSSYLKRYYEKKGCITTTIPPLVVSDDEANLKLKTFQHLDALRLVYAGNPFPVSRKITSEKAIKDRIDKAIEILHGAMGVKFCFDIYGLTKEEYLIAIPKHEVLIEKMSDSVIFHGRTSNENVKKAVAGADFYFLIRDRNKMCDAGFPSKVTESIGLGTPVICTDTSDIRQYLPDREMAYYLPSDDLDAAIEVMKSILKTDKQAIASMSRSCAINNPFTTTRYHHSTAQFFSSIGLTQ